MPAATAAAHVLRGDLPPNRGDVSHRWPKGHSTGLQPKGFDFSRKEVLQGPFEAVAPLFARECCNHVGGSDARQGHRFERGGEQLGYPLKRAVYRAGARCPFIHNATEGYCPEFIEDRCGVKP